ncbi:hypothetical protein GDO81_012593 [Engystomops pustulosus]|uniref:Secreted protein n=1 Tax=Engystomops pustulosus TaxID=76066 RepID=A0AAV7AXN8_ENGPU|nr:hypothetical protein GDO81_012593 [Engystomops pustulosus]
MPIHHSTQGHHVFLIIGTFLALCKAAVNRMPDPLPTRRHTCKTHKTSLKGLVIRGGMCLFTQPRIILYRLSCCIYPKPGTETAKARN